MTDHKEFNWIEYQGDKVITLLTNPIIASFLILSIMGSSAYLAKEELVPLVKQLMNAIGNCK